MLVDDPTLSQRAWDLGQNILTAFATSLVTYFGFDYWKAKRHSRQRIERLTKDRESYARSAEILSAAGSWPLENLWQEYLRWLRNSNLDTLPGNIRAISVPYGVSTDGNGNIDLKQQAAFMAERIRETELPDA